MKWVCVHYTITELHVHLNYTFNIDAVVFHSSTVENKYFCFRFLENNAALKAQYMINKLMEFRDKEKKRLLDNPQLTLGDVTTVNLTIMEGGVQVRGSAGMEGGVLFNFSDPV